MCRDTYIQTLTLTHKYRYKDTHLEKINLKQEYKWIKQEYPFHYFSGSEGSNKSTADHNVEAKTTENQECPTPPIRLYQVLEKWREGKGG